MESKTATSVVIIRKRGLKNNTLKQSVRTMTEKSESKYRKASMGHQPNSYGFDNIIQIGLFSSLSEHLKKRGLANLERQIFKLKMQTREEKIKISTREKQNIIKSVRKEIVNFSESKKRSLQTADKMMTQFNKEMMKIKKSNFASKTEDAFKENAKERFQSFSVCLSVSKDGSQDYIKYSDGIYIICGGHGSNGKDVANYIAEEVFNKCSRIRNEGNLNQIAIKQIFQSAQRDLEFSGHDIAFSGCTCLLAICYDHKIIIANIGDSNVIMKNEHRIEILSEDHRLCRQSQRIRVQEAGGEVRRLETNKGKFVGPLRLWAPGKNTWGPGLSVSRSFGDKAARRYGVISEPEIFTRSLSFHEDFIVIGSVGLLESMSPQQIAFFIKKNGYFDSESRKKVCQLLAEEALKKSEDEFENISIIIIFI